MERAKQNIYWDCYTGYSSALTRRKDKENDYSFERIEQLYYFEHYADHIQVQNERNEKTRHTERNRTVTDLLTLRHLRSRTERAERGIGTFPCQR